MADIQSCSQQMNVIKLVSKSHCSAMPVVSEHCQACALKSVFSYTHWGLPHVLRMAEEF